MKKGGELEKVIKAAMAAGVLDIHKVLKDIRQREDSGEVGEVITVEIPTNELDMMKELMLGDMFRSEDEFLAFTQMMGLISMKYALDHPDDFDLDKFFSENEEDMKKEGW